MTLRSSLRFAGLVFLVLALAGMAAAAPRWVSLNGNPAEAAAPVVQVLDHSAARTTLQVTLDGFWVEDVVEAGETFQVIQLEGLSGTTMAVGAPMLPTINELVGIPVRSDLRVRVTGVQEATLPGYRVYPFQTPTTDLEADLPFVLDAAAYGSGEIYPRDLAAVSQPQIWRHLRLAELHLYPVRYNPSSGELTLARTLTVEVEYFGTNSHNALDNPVTRFNPREAAMYRAAVVNYDRLGFRETDTDEPGTKYLFIMKQEALAAAQPLIDYRHAQGYQTEVKIFPSTGFTTEADIKNYITQLFQASGLEYVLIVGDAYHAGGPTAVDVPMHWWSNTYSDSWYVSLQGDNDYYADLAIGRIVYDTIGELERQITKTLAYLTTPDVTSNWAEKSLLVAHMEQYPLKYTQCKEQIRTFNYALQTPIFGTAYGGAGATNQTVINNINNQGTGLLNYRGHGSQTAWTGWAPGNSFTATEVNQLTNVNKYFVHFDVCCDNMDIPGYNGNCLAETFMKATNAAIAVNGAIIPSYTIPNHDYDKEFYKGLYNNGLWNIGYASNYANLTVVNVHGTIGQSNYRTYLWLGDAAIDLWTNIPQNLTLAYESTINLATQDFTVTVTQAGQPVQNALVCAQSATAYARAFTNASGVAYLVFSEYPQAQTTVTITATAHNCLAATGTATVIPAAAPYDITLNVDPTGSTTIPAAGGSLAIAISFVNNEAYPIPASAWTDWIYPNGTIHAPFINRSFVLVPGATVSRNVTQTVAGSEPSGTYTYRGCIGTYPAGSIFVSDTFPFTKLASDGTNQPWVGQSTLSGWDDDPAGLEAAVLPQAYSLSQRPNPFNPETVIAFALPQAGRVRLAIYDTMGREVAVLVDGFRAAGVHEVTFQAGHLPSGVYLSDLQAGNVHLTSKMVLLK
ncbi:MAG: hypothetical protein C4524_09455 [Candidatus Zixiibacteriota bacterium]|nr:MAG: hypothetical protein C4524_09455 [candidate division Zixibacteria bacterium]